MTDNFELKIENMDKLVGALNRYPFIAAPVLAKAMQDTGFVFQQNTLKNDPVPWKTGNLLTSFRFRIGPGEARWFPRAKYAPFVEFGTKPHIIRPVRAKVLAWKRGGSAGYVTAASGRQYYKKTQGTYVVAQEVRHPGTKPKPFMDAIVRKSADEITRLFGQAGDIITREIARATN